VPGSHRFPTLTALGVLGGISAFDNAIQVRGNILSLCCFLRGSEHAECIVNDRPCLYGRIIYVSVPCRALCLAPFSYHQRQCSSTCTPASSRVCRRVCRRLHLCPARAEAGRCPLSLCEIFNIMLQGALLVRTPASVVACGLSVREFMYRQCCMSVLGQVLQALGST